MRHPELLGNRLLLFVFQKHLDWLPLRMEYRRSSTIAWLPQYTQSAYRLGDQPILPVPTPQLTAKYLSLLRVCGLAFRVSSRNYSRLPLSLPVTTSPVRLLETL